MRSIQVEWTGAMVAELVVRTEAGESAPVIARKMGVSDRAVWNKRRKLGIKPPKIDVRAVRRAADQAKIEAGYVKVSWTPANCERLTAMFVRRDRIETIAEAFGTTVNAIASKASKMRLSMTDEIDPLVFERMEELARAGWRPTRIALQCGVDLPKVHSLVGHLLVVRPLGYGKPPVRPRVAEMA